MDDVPGEQSSSRGPDFIDCHSIGILIRAIPVYHFETSELVSGGRDSSSGSEKGLLDE
jgi:hypothetical protein